jgi:CDP-diacylglycerol--serine O-phosphatidyltransferase
MVRYLADAANAVTTAGLLLSTLGLYLALSGHPEFAIAVVLWAVLADHLDGVVASRARNRSVEVAKMGKSLDGFSDLVHGAVFPSVILIQISSASYLSLFSAAVLLLAGALRLSYFSNFGLSTERRFMGVPITYDVPLLAVLFLLRPWLAPDSFPPLLNASFLVLATLHVAPIRVPAASGAMYGFIAAFGVGASALLVARGLA